ncbi:MAG: TonB-dependent receptor [Deltaproteobacteria bacterium]|jgi:vitamin B12 transporter|nr:TonB-dependent receptor [Deltaproteobacteria bacterium]
MHRRYLAAAAAAIAVSAGSLAEAQDSQREESFLDTLMVTASRTLERARDIPLNVEVVTEEEIRDSGAKDVTDILEDHGIQVTYTVGRNYGNDVISMRGFDTGSAGNDMLSAVQVLLNGRRIGMDSVSIMGLNSIERIEIIHGPGSVVYGSAGMGGVINIITKTGQETPQARAEIGGGSFGEVRSMISGSGRSGSLDVAAALMFMRSNNYQTGSGETVTKSDVGARYNYYLNLGWNFDERNRLGILFQGNVNDKANRPYTAFGTTASTPPEYRGRRYYDSQDKYVHSGDLTYEGANSSGDLTWLLRYYRGRTMYTIFREPFMQDGSRPRIANSINTSDFQGAQAQASWDRRPFQVTAGIDWYGSKMMQEQPRNDYTVADLSSYAKSRMSDVGAFVLAKLRLLADDSLTLSAGVRYDKFKINIDTVSARAPMREETRRYTKTLPSFGVAYSPVDFLKLRANVGTAYRVPTPRQLFGNFYMGSTYFLGDPNLRPESSMTVDFGFDVDRGGLIFSGTYFTTDFKDYISSTQIPGVGTQYLNIERATISGLEAKVKFNVGRALGAEYDLTPWAQWTRLLKYQSDDGKKLPGIAENVFSAGLDFSSDAAGLRARAKAVYHGKPKISSYRTQTAPAEQGGSVVFDFSVTKTLFDYGDNGRVSLTATVENVADRFYEDTGGTEMPGRAFYLGVVYDY